MTRSRDIADQQENLGGAVAPFVAGKNKIINGDFGVWQRGTSFSSSGVYTADRFLTNTDATFTLTQQTFTLGAAPVAGYEGQYFLRWAKSAGGSYLDLAQRIEDVRTFAGQTITLSFWARVSSGTASVEPYYVQDFGTGGSGAVAGALTAQTINTSWARYSFNLAVPSVTGKTIGTSSRLQISPLRILTSGAVTADIWGVQIENGPVATPFTTASGTIGGELALCQRYYQRYNFPVATGGGTNVGTAVNTTIFDTLIIPPVAFRVAPTAIDSLTLSMYYPPAGGQYNTGTFTITSFSTSNAIDIRYTHGSSVFTAGMGGFLTSSGNNGYIGLTAEL